MCSIIRLLPWRGSKINSVSMRSLAGASNNYNLQYFCVQRTAPQRVHHGISTLISIIIRKQQFGGVLHGRSSEFPFEVTDAEDFSHMLSILAEDNEYSEESVLRTLKKATDILNSIEEDDKALIGINKECDHLKKCIEKLFLDLTDTNRASKRQLMCTYLNLVCQLAADIDNRGHFTDNNCWRVVEQVLTSDDFDHNVDQQLAASICHAFRVLTQAIPEHVNAALCVGALLEIVTRHMSDPYIVVNAVSMVSVLAFQPFRDVEVKNNIHNILKSAEYCNALQLSLELHSAASEKVTVAVLGGLGMYLCSGMCQVETLYRSGILACLNNVYRDHMDHPLVLELTTDIVCLVCGVQDPKLAEECAQLFKECGVLDQLRIVEGKYTEEKGLETFMEGVSQAIDSLDNLLLLSAQTAQGNRPGIAKRLDAVEAEIVENSSEKSALS